jgi:hypothetical protein
LKRNVSGFLIKLLFEEKKDASRNLRDERLPGTDKNLNPKPLKIADTLCTAITLYRYCRYQFVNKKDMPTEASELPEPDEKPLIGLERSTDGHELTDDAAGRSIFHAFYSGPFRHGSYE